MLSTGYRMMVLLTQRQGCSPAEDLHPSQGGRSLSAHRANQVRSFAKWYLATWNVGTARQGSEAGEVSVVDERKIDQVVGELDRYKVVVGALQETKCMVW